jgi:hypothetical protein
MDEQETQSESKPPLTPSDLEMARFEFERATELKRFGLEQSKLRQARTDTWTRLLGSIVIGAFVTGGIQLYTWANAKQERALQTLSAEHATKMQLASQRVQVGIQLAVAREKALSDLRAQMLTALLKDYFKQGSELERITILKLIALNFRDSVQIKPLFELLDFQLQSQRGGRPPGSPDLRKALRNVARDINSDQVNQIRQAHEGCVTRVTLKVSSVVTPDCLPQLRIQLKKVETADILVRTNSINGSFQASNDGGLDLSGDEFMISYFDMPMVDYTAVKSSVNSDSWRYSLVLYKTLPEERAAEVGVAVLPVSAVSAEQRYAFDDLLATFLTHAEEEH